MPASEITVTLIGSGLGAEPLCERCMDFFPVKAKKKARKKKSSDDDRPMFLD